ncbi:hypothetical protein AX15_006848 [Amanita polypyramis BW_CC]|nr:hypothetical protein AX15_006848 [Amanita polypyramis BW_CC]
MAPSQNVLNIEPYLLGNTIPNTDEAAITACLWMKDTEDPNLLIAWAHSWPGSPYFFLWSPRIYALLTGPLSVLMSTTATTSSSAHSNLLKKFHDLKNRLRKTRTSLHLLHVKTHNSSVPNMYLNLARIFAPTSRVVLFPAPIAHLPPRELYYLAVAQDSQYPAVVTTLSRTTYPFMTLSPVLLHRNHNTWCSERHFVHSHRFADWQECVWQIWAESLGKAAKIIIHEDIGELNDDTEKADVVRFSNFSL